MQGKWPFCVRCTMRNRMWSQSYTMQKERRSYRTRSDRNKPRYVLSLGLGTNWQTSKRIREVTVSLTSSMKSTCSSSNPPCKTSVLLQVSTFYPPIVHYIHLCLFYAGAGGNDAGVISQSVIVLSLYIISIAPKLHATPQSPTLPRIAFPSTWNQLQFTRLSYLSAAVFQFSPPTTTNIKL